MSDEELIAWLRDLAAVLGKEAFRIAADRIAALTAQNRELALDVLASSGQAQEAYAAQLVAEAERDALRAKVARLEGAVDERPDAPAHIVEYTNYRGETARRCIIPIRMCWGSTEWHPEEQWMLTAWDLDKNASRDFAWQDMRPVQNPSTSAALAAADARAEALLKRAAQMAYEVWDDPEALAKAILALITEKQP